MAPRGLSAEEKRVRLLEIFHETKDFFQLKELEKMAPKMKGIVSQSVKEVLQSLVDDNLVQTDKVGSSNFFWSFPSQRGAMMHNRLDAARETRSQNSKQLEDLETTLKAEKGLRHESESRRQALETLASSRKELVSLQQELAQYGACDPVKVEEKKRAVTLAKEAAIRWTDNYSILLSHVTRQTVITAPEVRAYLEIDEDYDDIC